MRVISILLLGLLVFGCSETIYEPEAMLAEDIKCPAGSEVRIDRWGPLGENGWLKACFRGSIKHGPFMAWRNEIKRVSCHYEDGLLNGLCVYYWGNDGEKTKETNFVAGKEVSTVEY